MRAIGALALIGALVSGCSNGGAQASDRPAPLIGSDRAEVGDAVPATIAGLVSQEEDVSEPLEEAGDRAYVSDVRLWSLRQGDRLRATIQVARFDPDAPVEDEAFRRSVTAQLKGAAPRERKVGDEMVFVSGSTQQVFYAWFRGVHLVLVAIPTETPGGRTILREALQQVKP